MSKDVYTVLYGTAPAKLLTGGEVTLRVTAIIVMRSSSKLCPLGGTLSTQQSRPLRSPSRCKKSRRIAGPLSKTPARLCPVSRIAPALESPCCVGEPRRLGGTPPAEQNTAC